MKDRNKISKQTNEKKNEHDTKRIKYNDTKDKRKKKMQGYRSEQNDNTTKQDRGKNKPQQRYNNTKKTNKQKTKNKIQYYIFSGMNKNTVIFLHHILNAASSAQPGTREREA